MRQQSAFLAALATLAVIVSLVVPSSASPALSPRTNAIVWEAAPTCCKGCAYAGGCCCAARDKLPFTKTKYTKTKTEVHYKTVTSTPKKIGKRSLGDGSSGPFSPASASETEINMPSSAFSPPKDSSESLVSSLFARHVCPRCPIGAKMGKNNGGAKYYCCPARKTVTKSAVLTLRSTRTITKAPPATIIGRVWYDNNKNGIYDPPPVGTDQPISNTVIVLVYATPKHARRDVASGRVDVLGRNRTDSQGHFVMTFDRQSPGISLNVVKDSERFVPLLTFVTNAQGGADVNVPILRPKDPIIIDPAVVLDNIIRVKGGGANATHTSVAYLYSDGKLIGTGTVAQDGTVSLVATVKVRSGPHAVSITLADPRNAESYQVSAGSVAVIMPPKWNSTTLKVNIAEIKGTGTPGAVVKVWDENNVFMGSAIVEVGGSWTVNTPGLAVGKHTFNATQTDITGESDVMDAHDVTVTVPLPAPPVVTSTSLDQGTAIATVQGTGQSGATIKLYADGIYAGTAVVDGQGHFTVSTPALAVGTHTLAITQTLQTGATSDVVPADDVTVLAKTTTKTAGRTTTRATTTLTTFTKTATTSASKTTVCDRNIRLTSDGFFNSADVAGDSQGNTYQAGSFNGNFTVDNVPMFVYAGGNLNSLVIKWNYRLNATWIAPIATNIWDPSNVVDFTGAIHVDVNDDVYTGGDLSCDQGAGCEINGTNFTSTGAAVVKFSKDGQFLWWYKYKSSGCTGTEDIRGITSSPDGTTVYITGEMRSGTYIDGSVNMTLTSQNGDPVTAVIALDAATGAIKWGVNPLRGGAASYPSGIEYVNGNLFISGYFYYDAVVGSTTLVANGNDVFAVSLSASNGTPNWASRFGGDGNDQGDAIAADATGVYIAAHSAGFNGTFAGTFFDGSLSPDKNFFMYKLDLATGNPIWARRFDGDSDDEPRGATLTPDGGFVVGGFAESTFLDFGNGFNWTNPIPGYEGIIGGLIVKLDKATGNTLAWTMVAGKEAEYQTWTMGMAMTSDGKLRAAVYTTEPSWTVDPCNTYELVKDRGSYVVGMEQDLSWQARPP